MGIYNLGGGGGAPELQAKEATPLITNAQQIILPDEGYDGLSKVMVNPMPTGALKTPTVNSIGYVSSGVQTAGYLGTSATSGLQLSTQSARTITPTTYSQTAVASGKYTTGAVTVAGDSDLIASNIRSGVNIFGVNGDLHGIKNSGGMTTTGSGNRDIRVTLPFTIPNDYDTLHSFNINNASNPTTFPSLIAAAQHQSGINLIQNGKAECFSIIQWALSGQTYVTQDYITFTFNGNNLLISLNSTSSMYFENGGTYLVYISVSS